MRLDTADRLAAYRRRETWERLMRAGFAALLGTAACLTGYTIGQSDALTFEHAIDAVGDQDRNQTGAALRILVLTDVALKELARAHDAAEDPKVRRDLRNAIRSIMVQAAETEKELPR